jgi:hypothetical protein
MIQKYFNPLFDCSKFIQDVVPGKDISDLRSGFINIVNNTEPHKQNKKYIVDGQECGQIKFLMWKFFANYLNKESVTLILDDLDSNFMTYIELFRYLNPQEIKN